jgi:hypothetical protein
MFVLAVACFPMTHLFCINACKFCDIMIINKIYRKHLLLGEEKKEAWETLFRNEFLNVDLHGKEGWKFGLFEIYCLALPRLKIVTIQ